MTIIDRRAASNSARLRPPAYTKSHSRIKFARPSLRRISRARSNSISPSPESNVIPKLTNQPAAEKGIEISCYAPLALKAIAASLPRPRSFSTVPPKSRFGAIVFERARKRSSISPPSTTQGQRTSFVSPVHFTVQTAVFLGHDAAAGGPAAHVSAQIILGGQRVSRVAPASPVFSIHFSSRPRRLSRVA